MNAAQAVEVNGNADRATRRASASIDLYTRSTGVVASRQRRTGYRAGVMPEKLSRALTAEVDRLDRVDDPIQQIREAGDLLAAIDVELERIATIRLQAISTLRGRQMSYNRIVEATGLSYPRVAQLAQQAGVGGRRARRAKTTDS